MKKNLNGSEIKRLRKTLELTQEVFADQIGISPSYLSDIELGKKTPSKRIIKSIEGRYEKVREEQNTYAEPSHATGDRGHVISEVLEILDSGNTDIIEALVKNVREFSRAVNMANRVHDCEAEIIILKNELDQVKKDLHEHKTVLAPDTPNGTGKEAGTG
jgi:transcriptional regulator with XRE-family HTH domain